jgi:hypothetical protein
MPKNGKKQNRKVVNKLAKAVKSAVQRKGNKRKPIKPTMVGKALRELGGAAGTMFGMPMVGRSLGAGISRITGQGDYSLAAPKCNSLMMGGGPPAFSPLSSGFRIKHREYIQDIQSSTTFASTAFNINPGLPNLFPWLSSVAQNFEEYRIHGMIFYLNSLSATAVSSTNTALGLWGAVTVYDPTEPDFTTKQQCENYVGCQTAVPSCSVLHGIECKPNVNVLDRLYVRQGTITDSEDLKFYDVGKTQIFTQGSQAVATIGELWISYDIEFMKPKLPTNQSNFVATDRYQLNATTDANPLGVGNVPVAGSSLFSSINATGTIITIPANAPNTNYFLTIRWLNAVATAYSPPTVTFGGTVNGKLWFEGNTLNQIPAPSSGSSTARKALVVAFSKSGAAPGTLTFASAGGVVGTADLFITQAYSGLAEKQFVNRLAIDEVDWIKKFIKQQMKKKSPLSIKSPAFDPREETLEDSSCEEIEMYPQKIVETPSRSSRSIPKKH